MEVAPRYKLLVNCFYSVYTVYAALHWLHWLHCFHYLHCLHCFHWLHRGIYAQIHRCVVRRRYDIGYIAFLAWEQNVGRYGCMDTPSTLMTTRAPTVLNSWGYGCCSNHITFNLPKIVRCPTLFSHNNDKCSKLNPPEAILTKYEWKFVNMLILGRNKLINRKMLKNIIYGWIHLIIYAA